MGGYFDEIGGILKNKVRRASFAMYAFGILGDGERKSVEPIAARACGDPALARAYHEKLLHFVGDAKWDDTAVRRAAARYGISAMEGQAGEAVSVWIVDDTGMLKQGDKSPGVQRQYTGSAGKITNCQIAVTLSVATSTEAIPIDAELYLPESWIADPDRRKQARIPETAQFRTKIELALEMVERACLDKIPGNVMLADSAYGEAYHFRQGVKLYGFDYAVGIGPMTKVVVANNRGDFKGEAVSAGQLGTSLPTNAFRRFTWRDGTKSRLSGRFQFRRVKAAHDDGIALKDRDEEWLLIELDESGKHKYYLTNLPKRMAKKQIVRILKERWRTEQVYQELKDELGFDHFEGRTYQGWHHHVSVVFCCYAFVVAERMRRFPPSKITTANHPQLCAA